MPCAELIFELNITCDIEQNMQELQHNKGDGNERELDVFGPHSIFPFIADIEAKYFRIIDGVALFAVRLHDLDQVIF